ncbi:MAG: biotin--[acetyl-CoA-carboxylase] ligase [Chloroflexi bacterium]|nr:biotin--[acetyl-CoA-carboxylase] ligase [Chloroflexota bacterium]
MQPSPASKPPLDVLRLRRLLAGNRLAGEVIYKPQTGSTNNDALAAARGTAPEGTLFITDFQTQGRGTRGRTWRSPGNTSLLLSVILRPTRVLKPVELTQLAALGLCNGLRESTSLDVRIKWPNDAMVRDKKIGGVLVEPLPGSAMAAVVGIGANLNLAASDIGLAEGSVTSVLDETGSRCDRELVIAAVVDALERSYRALEDGGSLFEDWTAQSAVIGRSVSLRTETRTYVGAVSGFDPGGELLLDCEDGTRRRFTAGRLELL